MNRKSAVIYNEAHRLYLVIKSDKFKKLGAETLGKVCATYELTLSIFPLDSSKKLDPESQFSRVKNHIDLKDLNWYETNNTLHNFYHNIVSNLIKKFNLDPSNKHHRRVIERGIMFSDVDNIPIWDNPIQVDWDTSTAHPFGKITVYPWTSESDLLEVYKEIKDAYNYNQKKISGRKNYIYEAISNKSPIKSAKKQKEKEQYKLYVELYYLIKRYDPLNKVGLNNIFKSENFKDDCTKILEKYGEMQYRGVDLQYADSLIRVMNRFKKNIQNTVNYHGLD